MDDMLFYGYPFLLLIMMALSALGGGPQCSLALTYVSFVALALSAHIVWRRLRWVPVAGELVGVYKYPGTRPVVSWNAPRRLRALRVLRPGVRVAGQHSVGPGAPRHCLG